MLGYRAERGIRPTVIARKISFGSQGDKGARDREIIMTVLHTVRARGGISKVFLLNVLNALAEKPKANIKTFMPLKK